MVAVSPFCALRFNPDAISDLSHVIAPPYDVIDPEAQDGLYQASPYNVVRLTLGKQFPQDTPSDNRYTRAAQDFTAWCTQGVLRTDPRPALYLLEQTFTDNGRRCARLGFIALLELREDVERSVYRHEATLAAPKADRTKLLEAVPANLEPIFCLYPDEGGRLQALWQEARTRLAPSAQALYRSGTGQAATHEETIRLWVVPEPELVQRVSSALSSVSVLIADGHHRFEVAYVYRSRFRSLMTYFVSMEDPALSVRPIHRVVRHAGEIPLLALRGLCTFDRVEDLPSLVRWLDEPDGAARFGCYDGKALYCVTADPTPLARWLMAPSVPLPLATLDVSILHGLILPALGVDDTDVWYTPDASQALDRVTQGQGSSAWLLRGVSIQQVYALAAQGFTLPPKSTYFFPKVPSGITIYSCDPCVQ